MRRNSPYPRPAVGKDVSLRRARRLIRATRTVDAEKPTSRIFLIRSANHRLPLVITFPPMLSPLLPGQLQTGHILTRTRSLFLRTLVRDKKQRPN